jgi:hypothetical protein
MAVSSSLSGRGSHSTDELEERFGSLQEAGDWIAAVFAEMDMIAAVQQGSCIQAEHTVAQYNTDGTVAQYVAEDSDSWRSRLLSAGYWNRLYRTSSGWLRPCHLDTGQLTYLDTAEGQAAISDSYVRAALHQMNCLTVMNSSGHSAATCRNTLT